MGGNAIDAAVATVFALTVVEPMMVSIFGAGFVNFYDASTGNIVIGLLVLAWLIAGQLRKKPLTAKTRLGLILAVVGLVETWNFAQHTHLTDRDVALTGLSVRDGP